VITRLSEMAVPLFAAIALIIFLYKYLEHELTRTIRDEDASVRLRLADLRTEGVELRNECQTLRIEIDTWITRCDYWTERALKTIKQLDEADAEWFKTLDAVPQPRIPLHGSYHREQIKRYREHDYYLVKLERLIEKYRKR
jgi:hypothetical protein